MRRPSRSITVAAAVTVFVLVFACGGLVLVPRSRAMQPVAAATQEQIQQLAVEFAQDEYAGTVTTVAVRQTTQGAISLQQCSWTERLRTQITLFTGTATSDWCDDNRPMWDVALQGEFRNMEGNTVRALRMAWTVDGNISMVAEGPAQER